MPLMCDSSSWSWTTESPKSLPPEIHPLRWTASVVTRQDNTVMIPLGRQPSILPGGKIWKRKGLEDEVRGGCKWPGAVPRTSKAEAVDTGSPVSISRIYTKLINTSGWRRNNQNLRKFRGWRHENWEESKKPPAGDQAHMREWDVNLESCLKGVDVKVCKGSFCCKHPFIAAKQSDPCV